VAWGNAVATLSDSLTHYIDASVAVGVSYEYKVTRTTSGYAAYGYINAGIQIPIAAI